MSSGQTIDIDALLKAIEGANPAGKDVSQGKSVAQLKEARREDDPRLPQGEWERELKAADWPKVVQIATKILATESKDLQVATWLVEGLVKRQGFAGLRDGMKMLTGLHEQYWPSMFPLIDDGDVEFRLGHIEALTKKILPISLKMVPIVKLPGGVEYGYSHYEESRVVKNLRLGGAKTQDALAAALADGKVDDEVFDKAVAGMPLNQCTVLLEDLVQCQEELARFNQILEDLYKDAAPSVGLLKQAVDDSVSFMDDLVRKKGGVGIQRVTQEGAAEPHTKEPTMDVTTPVAPGGGISPINRVDALRRLSAIAEFFKRTEPHSPVSYLVQRAARWGDMPLEEWLREVVKNEGVLGEIRETLGIAMQSPERQ